MTQKGLVLNLLREVGKPMHYKDITEKLIEGRVVVSGAKPENTINRCCNELVKEGLLIGGDRSGMYAIKMQYCNMTHKEAICALLQEKGEPMHYKEITNELIKKGLSISGEKPENTINRDCNNLVKDGVLMGNHVGFFGYEI